MDDLTQFQKDLEYIALENTVNKKNNRGATNQTRKHNSRYRGIPANQEREDRNYRKSSTTRQERARKRSIRNRIAGVIAAVMSGAMLISGISLAQNRNNELPEENRYIHNTAVDMSANQQDQLASLEEEFATMSPDLSSAEINAFGQKLYEANMDYLKDKLLDAYNKDNDYGAFSVEVYRDANTPSDAKDQYVAVFNAPSPGRSSADDRILLRGDNIVAIMDNIMALQDYDVYHDGYDTISKYGPKTIENLKALDNCILSYDEEHNSITAYEVEKEASLENSDNSQER